MDLQYGVGDVIVQRDGTVDTRTVYVTAKLANVKDGLPGFHGRVVAADREVNLKVPEVWGYDEDILRVVARVVPAITLDARMAKLETVCRTAAAELHALDFNPLTAKGFGEIADDLLRAIGDEVPS